MHLGIDKYIYIYIYIYIFLELGWDKQHLAWSVMVLDSENRLSAMQAVPQCLLLQELSRRYQRRDTGQTALFYCRDQY